MKTNDRVARRKIALMEIDIDKSGDCWEWTGRKNKSGYGLTAVRGGSEIAHRAYWQLVVGEVPDGMYLLHSCDNKCCVNPAHLRVGTHAENMAEAKERKRMRPMRGIDNGRAKITYEIADAIRADVSSSNVSLGKKYGVSDVVISNVRLGRSWVRPVNNGDSHAT